MVSKILLPLAAIASCTASVLPTRDASTIAASTLQKNWISLPISHRVEDKPLRRRDQDVPLYNITSISYLVELSIGTPGQPIRVAIDTGSDELWVNPDCSDINLTSGQQQECLRDEQYDPRSSSTAQQLQSSQEIKYGKGYVQMRYYTDDVALPDSTLNVTNLQFGVAIQTLELNEGILGLGWGKGTNLNYENLIDAFASQGVTNTKAFSIGLGDVEDSNGGTLLFGAVDTKKFAGPLVSNPILGPQGNEPINRYWIQMDSIAYNKKGSGKTTYGDSSMPIVLDSGSSLSYLPQSIVKAMANDLNGVWDERNSLYMVDCSVRSLSDTFDFTFGRQTIRVPMHEFLWNYGGSSCVLGAVPVDPNSGVTAILGDTFMRAAFIVFDQTEMTISMAQYVDCGENEQEIPQGGAGNFTGECQSGLASGNSNDESAAGRATIGVAGFAIAAIASLMLAL